MPRTTTTSGETIGPTPVSALPNHDFGAETLRNYRYQSAYAIVLLVAAAVKRLDYVAVWCEQEDDILAETSDRKFDDYQIKTRAPENGPWTLTDEPLINAIQNFIRLDTAYRNHLRTFNFVSNADCLESTAQARKHLCPKPLVNAAASCLNSDYLRGSAADGFKTLLQKT